MKPGSIRARVKLRLARRKKAVSGKKKARVAGGFWEDVKAYRELSGESQREGMKTVRGWKKYVDKRWARMSKKRRDLASQEIGGEGKIKQTIIERAMEKAGITDMNKAKDYWEAKGS